MASLEQDKHLLDIGNLWKLEQEDTHLEEGLGARHPVNKPNSTPRQLEEQHQHADMPKPSFCGVASTGGGQKRDWSVHLTGLVGWWRRVESTQTKEDEKIRKFRENSKN